MGVGVRFVGNREDGGWDVGGGEDVCFVVAGAGGYQVVLDGVLSDAEYGVGVGVEVGY